MVVLWDDAHCSSSTILLFQGGATNNHVGNVRYRILVQDHQNEYLHAAKTEKKEVARSIVSIIRSKGGGFLKKCNDGRVGWTDIGDTKAREKTSQALREGLDVLTKDLEQQQNQEMAGSGLSAAEAAAATITSPEATIAGAKRKAGDDVADDGSNKKKPPKPHPRPLLPPRTSQQQLPMWLLQWRPPFSLLPSVPPTGRLLLRWPMRPRLPSRQRLEILSIPLPPPVLQ